MAGLATFRCRSCRTTWRWITLPSRVSSWCGWQSSRRGFRYFQLANHRPRLSLIQQNLLSVPAAVWMGSSTICAGGVRKSFCTCSWRSSFDHLEVCWIPFTTRWSVLLLLSFLLILALLFGLQLLKAEANAQKCNSVDVMHAYLMPTWSKCECCWCGACVYAYA